MGSNGKAKGRPRAVLITGAGGYVGRLVTRALAAAPEPIETIVATDIRPPTADERIGGVTYRQLDVRAPSLAEVLREHGIDTVVHLAAIVTPGADDTRELQYAVDVEGTDNVLASCVEAGVGRLVYTSSGAAYGYHADNPALLDEEDALRGNEVFAYAWHKRLVEERLAHYRREHPELGQLVFRVGTILGESVDNQITALFERPIVLGLREAETPFCFVWDEDVVGCIVRGVFGDETGTFNLTGDGVMTLRECAHAAGRRYVALPSKLVEAGIGLLRRAELTRYGTEQILFLKHRPVLANRRLKEEFGYLPRRTSRQVFELYRRARA